MENSAIDEHLQYHLIDDEANFREGMTDFLKQHNLLEAKRNYNIVSVIGSQSSGKSTLLNNLFGTNFKVMQQKIKRTQTTKGIFVSQDKEKPLLILDVEGNDSIQRGDDRQFYGKSTGIFALALSQVLIVNIWTNMIGNYEGQQLGIIKVIFEMNLKLFKVDQVKSIVFVLRDYDPDENFDEVKASINQDLLDIWKEIKKPEQFDNKTPQDLFNIDIFTVSSFKLQKEQFISEISSFRQRFTNPEDEQYYFKDFDYSQNLPIDGLNDYIANIWDTIKNNKDINLPNEKEIVSQIRCESIKKEALEISQPIIKELGEKVQQGVCDSFSEIAKKAFDGAIQYYDQKADYMPSIMKEKRDDLQHQIVGDIYTLFVTQIQQAKKLLTQELNKQLSQQFNQGILSNLKKLHNISESALQQVTSVLINSLVFNDVNWEKEKIEEEFKSMIEQALENKFSTILIKQFTENIDNSVVQNFNDFQLNFWSTLQKVYDDQVMRLEQDYIPIMKFSSNKAETLFLYFKDQIFSIIESKIKEKLLNINDFMMKKFQKDFRYKNNGTPENWKAMEESAIEEKFQTCKDKCIKILNIFKFNGIKNKGAGELNFLKPTQSLINEGNNGISNLKETTQTLDDLDLPRLLNEQEINKFKTEFEKQIAEEMQIALRAKNTTDLFGVPKFIWALLIFFGYDDVFRMLSNPFLMTPLVMVLGAVALAFSTGNQALVYTGAKMASTFVQSKLKTILK